MTHEKHGGNMITKVVVMFVFASLLLIGCNNTGSNQTEKKNQKVWKQLSLSKMKPNMNKI
ncbi:hypothetical protein ACFY5J_09090 [Peribacillus butanolivorans]|uniref:hypothetical protein n=1 Tax=Peribacillus butanolivorans TaxID=421767 RepID=UPI0036D205A6